MSEIVYIDGQYYPRESAKISVFDHGFLYGDGVFEGIRAYDGCIFRLREHLERLYASARYLLLTIPYTAEELTEIVKETCRRNNLRSAYIRLIVSRGDGELGLSPSRCPRACVICIAGSIKMYPKECYDNGMAIITASTERNAAESINPRVKSLNYVNNILGKIEAENANAFEALMCNREGFIVEATADNVFVVSKGSLLTPPTWQGALRGITRDAVIESAKKLGIPVTEEPITRYEVYNADEMFLTGTAAEVIPVTKVDRRPIGTGMPGPITAKLLEQFRAMVRSDGEKF